MEKEKRNTRHIFLVEQGQEAGYDGRGWVTVTKTDAQCDIVIFKSPEPPRLSKK